MTTDRAPIAVALDTADLSIAVGWTAAVAPHVSTVKVGLELFCHEGPTAVEKIRAAADVSGRGSGAQEIDVFLDLKLHDIPATVAGAARSVAHLQPRYLTVHAAGGAAMVSAAAEALPETLVAGVTVLTSLAAGDLDRIGLAGPPHDAVRRLARLAVEAGARALVCSPQEVRIVREEVGPDVVLITPGVRPVGASTNDQARIATPEQALADGADLLVVGRPITGSADPGAAAAALGSSLR
jgi:orotidine-5'-phosphate decarboxylase